MLSLITIRRALWVSADAGASDGGDHSAHFSSTPWTEVLGTRLLVSRDIFFASENVRVLFFWRFFVPSVPTCTISKVEDPFAWCVCVCVCSQQYLHPNSCVLFSFLLRTFSEFGVQCKGHAAS
jgi:hypothetical protein